MSKFSLGWYLGVFATVVTLLIAKSSSLITTILLSTAIDFFIIYCGRIIAKNFCKN